jgi:hypothetical protein
LQGYTCSPILESQNIVYFLVGKPKLNLYYTLLIEIDIAVGGLVKTEVTLGEISRKVNTATVPTDRTKNSFKFPAIIDKTRSAIHPHQM